MKRSECLARIPFSRGGNCDVGPQAVTFGAERRLAFDERRRFAVGPGDAFLGHRDRGLSPRAGMLGVAPRPVVFGKLRSETVAPFTQVATVVDAVPGAARQGVDEPEACTS